MAKLTKESFIESLKEMNIKEVMELVEAMKEEFGIDPTATIITNPIDDGDTKEKTEFTVNLKAIGGNKVAVIKAVKEALELGLMDAKKLVESAPILLKENVKKEIADEMKSIFEVIGAEIEIV